MKISKIQISGYKSFGFNTQTLTLNDNGGLILLYGDNGNGKSSLIETFPFTIYGKIKGRDKKTATLSSVVNRRNNTLRNKIFFENDEGDKVEITRTLNPNNVTLNVNNVDFDKSGKINIKTRINELIGIDSDIFNSFISMSINDFKNFTSLSNEDRETLLDKLFNMELLNILREKLKLKNRENERQREFRNGVLLNIEDTINNLSNTIDKMKEKSSLKEENELTELKNTLITLKSKGDILKKKIMELKDNIKNIDNEINSEKQLNYKYKTDISKIESEIELFNKDKCPTCSTDFKSSMFIEMKELLEDKLELLKTSLNESNDKIRLLSIECNKFKKLYEIGNSKNSLVISEMKVKKELYLKINKNEDNEDNYQEIIKVLEDNRGKKKENESVVNDLKLTSMYYKELSNILGNDGVKKTIIKSILPSLNLYVSENTSYMGLRFKVEIDDSFKAIIKDGHDIIDHDTMSTGEHRKVNICIMIAYLKVIRSKKNVNILFLDEVFSSLDFDGIEKLLILFKKMAMDYKMNIFIVHPMILFRSHFDRVIKMEKNTFTKIIEE